MQVRGGGALDERVGRGTGTVNTAACALCCRCEGRAGMVLQPADGVGCRGGGFRVEWQGRRGCVGG